MACALPPARTCYCAAKSALLKAIKRCATVDVTRDIICEGKILAYMSATAPLIVEAQIRFAGPGSTYECQDQYPTLMLHIEHTFLLLNKPFDPRIRAVALPDDRNQRPL